MRRRLLVAGAAVALDLAAGELPNRWHPVAWLGSGIARADAALPQATREERRRSGFVIAGAFVGGAALAGLGVRRALRGLPALLAFAVEAAALKQAFAIRALFEHAETVAVPLERGDLAGARRAASFMVSRATDGLSESLVASAAVESLTENSSDSIVAPLAWYFALGLPGAFAYRAANTLDATIGYRHRGEFGAPSARLDDALNFLPARMTAALIAGAGSRAAHHWDAVRRDAAATPSPNAGWPMAAAAHALDLRLEKPGHHTLNASGREPAAGDIQRARVLVARALALGAAATVAAATARRWRR